MEKKMNYLWLFLLVVTVIALAVMFWAFSGPTTGSYSGGILIELPALPTDIAASSEYMMTAGEWL